MRKQEEHIPLTNARGVRVAIVASDYHREIHDRLLAGARAAFTQAGGAESDLKIVIVDGVFDIAPVAAEALEQGLDAVVVLGCVVQGETRHDRHIVDAAFSECAAMAVRYRKPVALGILTVESHKQARERSGGGKGDAGAFAMRAALRTREAIRSLHTKGRA